jgi:hypothetical protein
MSTDLRKRVGGGAPSTSTHSSSGLPRPGSSPIGHDYRRSPPPPAAVGYASPGGGSAPSRPPPPPFPSGGGGTGYSSVSQSPGMYQAKPSVAVTTTTTPHYTTASPYQAPSRPAYNYPAVTGSVMTSSSSGNGGGAGGGTYGGYGGYSGGGGTTAMTTSTAGSTANGNYAFATNGSDRRRANLEDNKYKKKKRPSDNSESTTIMFMGFGMVLLTILAIIMTILFVSSRGKTNAILKQLDKTSLSSVVEYTQSLESRLTNTQRQLTRAKQETSRQDTQKISTLQKENRLFQQQLDDLKKKYESPDSQRQTQRLKDRELAFSEQVQWLQASARRESKRAILERYENG